MSLYSYSASALAFSVLFLLIVINGKKNTVALPFLIATCLSVIWSAYSAYAMHHEQLYAFDVLGIETLRNGGWYFFLSVLISRQQFGNQYAFLLRYWQPKAMLAFIAVVCLLEFYSELRYQIQNALGFDFRLYAHIFFALVGLMLVEQLYRNALAEQRWHIKFVCIALAAQFVFDFIIYSKSLMFSSLDFNLWNARGLINALLVPLLILSVNRLNTRPAAVAVSRQFIFHTTVLLGGGVYLLLMSLMGFYIRDYGGNWGGGSANRVYFLGDPIVDGLFCVGAG
ncbi:hypothetical protein Q9L42_010775 [Methylomarinum sp. Ch1-1]|uniref:Uncharacterized protein n=1 Tax=Methylomarinum roseum TaxID=3067653 RepID=A0AAU7NPH8_9GAMM